MIERGTLNNPVYLASITLAVVTLGYIFGPSLFVDSSQDSRTKKLTVVGLSNPANDCFINSILQALSALPSLRRFLQAEVAPRAHDEENVYLVRSWEPDELNGKPLKNVSLVGLRQAQVCKGLKAILDELNERSVSRKTISARRFISILESAFQQRISRQQQDAQEFLQIVIDRIADEFDAGKEARTKAQKRRGIRSPSPKREPVKSSSSPDGSSESDTELDGETPGEAIKLRRRSTAEVLNSTFPFTGSLESKIRCLTCGFVPKRTKSTFNCLALNVPQSVSSCSLHDCFDMLLKSETISDFRCDRCRLTDAREQLKQRIAKFGEREIENIKLHKDTLARYDHVIATDPENPPKDLRMPSFESAPKRSISRSQRIADYPRLLAIHLSRSVYTSGNYAQKNSAKVAFPSVLELGSPDKSHKYRLATAVTHQGSHNSGHYEAFKPQRIRWKRSSTRRKSSVVVPRPQTAPNGLGLAGSRADQLRLRSSDEQPSHLTTRRGSATAASESRSNDPYTEDDDASSGGMEDSSPGWSFWKRGSRSNPMSPASSSPPPSVSKKARLHRRRKSEHALWWRISDDKVRECKLSNVLGMQREVYLLFYELIRPSSKTPVAPDKAHL